MAVTPTRVPATTSDSEMDTSTVSGTPGSSSTTEESMLLDMIQKGNATAADDERIVGLKAAREKMKKERHAILRENKNEKRKRQRLRDKANKLCTNDLVSVLAIRAKAASEAHERGLSKGSGSGKAEACQPQPLVGEIANGSAT